MFAFFLKIVTEASALHTKPIAKYLDDLQNPLNQEELVRSQKGPLLTQSQETPTYMYAGKLIK